MARGCLSIAAAMVLAAMVGGFPTAAAEEIRLAIGRISEKPVQHFARMRALADYLERVMAEDGVGGIDIVIVDSLDTMREMMRDGQVDIVSETAFMAVELANSGVADLLLREWKQGVAEYHTVFFARQDSGIKDIGDLTGRTIAFEDPGSTSAYLIPRMTLELAGFELAPLETAATPVPEGKIGYRFAEGESNIVAWVHRGRADAGVVSNLDWDHDDETPPHMRDDLVVIHRTSPIIRSILLVRSDLAPALKSRIAETLERMHLTEAGRKALAEYFSVGRYDRLDEAAMDGLRTVEEIRRLVGR